jgi:hypothetical protein
VQATTQTTTTTRATRRAPVKSLNQTSEQVARAAAADKARKAESKRALRAATKPATVKPEVVTSPVAPVADRSTDNLKAAKIEAVALSVSFEAACESMGISPVTGQPVDAKPNKHVYTGPMLALRERSKAGAYVKGANGNPHCNDAIAQAFAALTREQVVAACLQLLDLSYNPYTSLNPGQQSMNLRNKLRHQYKNGMVSASRLAQVVASFAA